MMAAEPRATSAAGRAGFPPSSKGAILLTDICREPCCRPKRSPRSRSAPNLPSFPRRKMSLTRSGISRTPLTLSASSSFRSMVVVLLTKYSNYLACHLLRGRDH